MKPIWIVDDDQSIRFVLEKALAREQFATRSFSNTNRMDWSSSTIQIGFMRRRPVSLTCKLRSRQRDHDTKNRSAGFAVALDHALMLLHKGLRQRQAEA